jgi:hypothetical protein
MFGVWALASACLGTAHEELSCALAFAATWLILRRWRDIQHRLDGALMNLLAGLVGLAAGTVFLLAAPGNYIRADYAPHPGTCQPW